MTSNSVFDLRTRRSVLGGAAAGGMLGMLGWPRLTLANAATDNRLVVVILRGAMDGLAAVPPYGDKSYLARRADLALPMPGSTGGIVPLDGFFGLNPALASLKPLWDKGELAVIPATAGGYRTRSHFDAQDLLEMGLIERRGEPDGWLNRSLAVLERDNRQRQLGLSVGASVPLILRGNVQVGEWEPPTLKAVPPELIATLSRLYDKDALLGPALRDGIKAQTLSDQVLGPDLGRPQKPQIEAAAFDTNAGGRMPAAQGDMQRPQGAAKPGQAYTIMAQAAGGLLASADGPRIAVLDIGGWDTHVNQGTTKGRLFNNLTILSSSLQQLQTALGPAWSNTVVVLVTEFGRTVAPNGGKGTDHGTASVMLAMGGAVRGGRIAGDWPSLDNLVENRDLRMATDSRAVMKGILRDHLGIGRRHLDTVIFPDSADVGPVDGLVRV